MQDPFKKNLRKALQNTTAVQNNKFAYTKHLKFIKLFR